LGEFEIRLVVHGLLLRLSCRHIGLAPLFFLKPGVCLLWTARPAVHELTI
jgi:hypothetical protein